MKIRNLIFILPLLFLTPATSWSYWVWSPETGEFVNPEGAPQDSLEEQYEYAMQFYKEKNYDEALKQLENLIDKNPGAQIIGEAQYRRGTIYEEKGDYWKAFTAYRDIVKSYPNSERMDEVIEREFRIANLFLSGKKAKLMGLEILPSTPKAIEIFKHIIDNAPYGAYGDQSQYRLGMTYKKIGQFDRAVESFQNLIEQYPQSEFVGDARFQIAETSFLRSQAAYRDQRALDSAASELDRFLARNPDSVGSEEAAKLRQKIDEKNAEKNYQVGLYYEKQSYLQSAMIYYKDVAERYPHTEWGKRAGERMRALNQPVSYAKEQKSEIDQEVDGVRAQLQAAGSDAEKQAFERKLERLELRQKQMDKNKEETLKRRYDDLKRREKELKDKFKRLAEKRKLLEQNPSPDLKKALDGWEASLAQEQEQLNEERQQITTWHESLGIKMQPISFGFLPFVGDSVSEIERVRRIEAKKYFNLSDEKNNILSEKEVLYKQRGEVLAQLNQISGDFKASAGGEALMKETAGLGEESVKQHKARLEKSKLEIKALEEKLDKKKGEYVERFGESNWLAAAAKLPVRAVSASLDLLNPFSSDEDLSEMDIQQLSERRMHLHERLSAQQGMVDTLTQAFDSELAMKEQRRLMENLDVQSDKDIHKLRKEIKTMEKQIRNGYEEIDERHERKKDLLEQLDQLVKGDQEDRGIMAKTASVVASPAVGVLRGTKAFLFGSTPKDVSITQNAQKTLKNSGINLQAQKLKEQIEEESLIIDAKYDEVLTLQKQLEALKAKASLEGGFKFRSSFVTIPYHFLRDAVESADRLIPRKDRDEKLLQLIEKETQELEQLKQNLAAVEGAIRRKDKNQPQAEENRSIQKSGDEAQDALMAEISSLSDQIMVRKETYEREKALLDAQMNALGREVVQADDQAKVYRAKRKELKGEGKKLYKELEEVESSIGKLIKRESELDQEEFSILEKRISKIDEFVAKVKSKASSEDLLVERKRIESRMDELELRRDFLKKEMQRFSQADLKGSLSV
ncbi:MAG: outer membrane protein assembly factor BamD [Candidatus Omnitrophica bacterium]|nr:outer membrane protein assembly factor BamD [Candidatus Omnitrophota bacterium]